MFPTTAETIEIRPQPGPQEAFLSSPADIAIYGGAAGGGKTWALLLDPLRHVRVPGFNGVIFRRETPQITNPGGLWDESRKLYPYTGAVSRDTVRDWLFPPHGTKIKFAHLQYDDTVQDWQGAQVCYLAFDELCHFSETQFFYMLSRNRSTCGVRPYVRATCNPDPDSWVAEYIAWWIDQETGYPIPERAGVLRWFVRINNRIFWGDTPDNLWQQVDGLLPRDDFLPKSVTFIPARLDDNPALTAQDPAYRANLLALTLVDRQRLLDGNWKIRPASGTMFRREWFQIIDADQVPLLSRKVRWWDGAATEPSDDNPDPDWTAGVLIGEAAGHYYILDVQHFRKSPGATEAHMQQTAAVDGRTVEIGMEQEPGSAGKREAERFAKDLFKGYAFTSLPSSGDKVVRAKPFSSACEHGLVSLVRGPWTQDYLYELERFPEKGTHDDQVDASAGAFGHLTVSRTRMSARGRRRKGT